MIDKIKQHPELKPFIAGRCEENEIFVSMAKDIPPGNYVVLKVDRYYGSLKLKQTPPSIDCLVPVKCSNQGFIIYLVELKKIKSPKGFTVNNIYGKFKTVIEDFMTVRYAGIFLDRSYRIEDLRLYFVTNPYRYRQKVTSHRRESTRMDALLSRGPFKFRDRLYQLKHILPNPVIENC